MQPKMKDPGNFTEAQKKKNDVGRVTEDFANGTSIHGLTHIFQASNKLFQSFWVLIVIAGFGKW